MGELLAAFGVVFLAELGDKTQLAAAGLATRYRAAPVAIGVVAGYLLVSTLSVAVGGLAGAALPTRAINLAAGALFLIVGVVALRSYWRGGEDDHGDELEGVAADAGREPRQVVLVGTIATTIAVAELGDKTMLATASLAAAGSPVPVWVGATLGICAAGLLGVLVGRIAGARLPESTLKLVGGLVFVAVGVAVLAAVLL